MPQICAGDADLLNHKVVGAGAEFLIKVSTVGQIRRLFQRIGGNFSRLMCGGGSSRVVELLLSIVFSAGTDLLEAEEAGEGGIPSLAQLVCRLVDEVASDVPDVFVHTFGSFSLRMLVRVLGGLPAKEKEAAAAAEDRPVFIGELNRICAQVAAAVSADVVGTCQETATNGCLQVRVCAVARALCGAGRGERFAVVLTGPPLRHGPPVLRRLWSRSSRPSIAAPRSTTPTPPSTSCW